MSSAYNIEELNKRKVNLDLLKVICMAMVVILHALFYGLEGKEISNFSTLHIIIVYIHSICIAAVNCFVLISSYFLSQKQVPINRDSLKKHYKRIKNLWIQVVTYSVVIWAVLSFGGCSAGFNIKDLIKQSLPILTNQYWYFTCYFLLYILSPFLNIVLNKLEADEYALTLIIMFVLFSVIPTVNIFGDTFGVKDGYSLTWFICLYFVGGYIYRFGLRERKNWPILYIAETAIISVFSLCSNLFPGVLGSLFNLSSNTYNSPIVLFSSICLFMTALNVKRNWCFHIYIARGIIRVANLSFGVYLLHEHNWFRNILWGGANLYCDNPVIFCLKLFLSTLIIFIFGISVEYMRQKLMRLKCKKSLHRTQQIDFASKEGEG